MSSFVGVCNSSPEQDPVTEGPNKHETHKDKNNDEDDGAYGFYVGGGVMLLAVRQIGGDTF